MAEKSIHFQTKYKHPAPHYLYTYYLVHTLLDFLYMHIHTSAFFFKSFSLYYFIAFFFSLSIWQTYL